jgi:hypothetical protein
MTSGGHRPGVAPESSRQLQALGHNPFEERLGKRRVGGACLAIAGKLHRHRILKVRHRCLNFPRDRICCRRTGADQDHAIDSLRVGDRDASGDETTKGVPHDGASLDGDSVEKRDDVSGELVDAVTATRPLRVAETSLIEDERMKPSRQERDDSAEREPGVWPAMQKDHRFAIAVAMLCVVDLRASRQSHCRELQVRHRLHS